MQCLTIEEEAEAGWGLWPTHALAQPHTQPPPGMPLIRLDRPPPCPPPIHLPIQPPTSDALSQVIGLEPSGHAHIGGVCSCRGGEEGKHNIRMCGHATVGGVRAYLGVEGSGQADRREGS